MDQPSPARRGPLRARLERAPRIPVLVALAAVALAMLAALAATMRESDRAGRRSLEVRAVQRSGITRQFVEAYVADLESSTVVHAELGLDAADPTAERLGLVTSLLRARGAVLLDIDGRVIRSWPDDPALVGADLSGRFEHVRQATTGVAAASGVVSSAVTGESVVAVAVPFGDPAARRVLSVDYGMVDSPLGRYLLEATVLPGEVLYLVDDSGQVITSSRRTGDPSLAEEDPELWAAAAGASTQGTYSGADGRRFFVSLAVEGAPWRLVRSLPTAAMYEPVDRGRWVPWALVAGFVAVGAASLLMLNWIMRQRDHERHRARRDPLTGLANRRVLDAALAGHAGGSRRWSVVMIDVDHFKSVNDRYGHQRGDDVITMVADAIASAVRPGDVVGRWGGEEFMAVVGGASLATAGELAERIRREVASREVHGITVTVSVGYASSETAPGDSLVDLADASLYRAKQTGRDRSVSLTPSEAFPVMAR